MLPEYSRSTRFLIPSKCKNPPANLHLSGVAIVRRDVDEFPSSTRLPLPGSNGEYFSKKMRNTISTWIFNKAARTRQEGELSSPEGKLFRDILVVLTGSIHDEQALNISLVICKLEGARLAGLFITEPRKKGADYRIGEINKEFKNHCSDTGIPAELAVGFAKDPAPLILRRSHLADLTIIALPVRYIHHFNLSSLVYRCSTPLLLVKRKETNIFEKWLLVVDGSMKSRKPLLLTAHAAKFWDIAPVVLSIETKGKRSKLATLDAHDYFSQYHVDAEYITAAGPTDLASILIDSEAKYSFIVTGVYNSGGLGQQLSGNAVDEIINKSSHTVMICK
jgi:hypothetical protein